MVGIITLHKGAFRNARGQASLYSFYLFYTSIYRYRTNRKRISRCFKTGKIDLRCTGFYRFLFAAGVSGKAKRVASAGFFSEA